MSKLTQLEQVISEHYLAGLTGAAACIDVPWHRNKLREVAAELRKLAGTLEELANDHDIGANPDPCGLPAMLAHQTSLAAVNLGTLWRLTSHAHRLATGKRAR